MERLKDDVSRFFHQNLVMSRIKIRAYIKTEWPHSGEKFLTKRINKAKGNKEMGEYFQIGTFQIFVQPPWQDNPLSKALEINKANKNRGVGCFHE